MKIGGRYIGPKAPVTLSGVLAVVLTSVVMWRRTNRRRWLQRLRGELDCLKSWEVNYGYLRKEGTAHDEVLIHPRSAALFGRSVGRAVVPCDVFGYSQPKSILCIAG